MLARRASITAVSGSALITGCITLGNRCAEKKTPEPIHMGNMTAFISPDAASMVCARAAINNPMEQKHNELRTHNSATPPSEPRTGT